MIKTQWDKCCHWIYFGWAKMFLWVFHRCHEEAWINFLVNPICVCAQSLSHIQLFVTPRTIACQASLSMEFSREYWSGLSFPILEGPADPGIKHTSSEPPELHWHADSLPLNWEARPNEGKDVKTQKCDCLCLRVGGNGRGVRESFVDDVTCPENWKPDYKFSR